MCTAAALLVNLLGTHQDEAHASDAFHAAVGLPFRTSLARAAVAAHPGPASRPSRLREIRRTPGGRVEDGPGVRGGKVNTLRRWGR